MVVCWAAGFSWAGGARDSKAHRPLAAHGRGNRGQERRPHSAVGSHGGTSSELRRDRAAVHCFQIRGHGEREEEEGVPFQRLRAWERGWEESGHGWPW